MYLLQRLRHLYESMPPDSTEYILSRHILHHLSSLQDVTVTSIAQDTAISKSAVSKFFKSLTMGQTFDAFRSSLQLDLQYLSLDDQTIQVYSQEFNQHFKKYFPLDQDSMHALIQLIKKGRQVIIYGNPGFHDCFDCLVNYLLVQGKDIRYVNWTNGQVQNNELSHMSKEDLLILLEPDNTLFEFILRANMSVDMFWDFNRLAAQKVFLGKESIAYRDILVVPLCETKNSRIQHLYLSYYISSLLAAYMKDDTV